MKPRVERWEECLVERQENRKYNRLEYCASAMQIGIDVTPLVFALDKSSLKTGGLVYRPGSRK